MADNEEPGMLVSKISVARYLDEHGNEIIVTDKGEASTTLLEAVGMLMFSALSVWNDAQRDDE